MEDYTGFGQSPPSINEDSDQMEMEIGNPGPSNPPAGPAAPTRRRGGRLPGPSVVLTKIEPLTAVVLDSDGDSWVRPQSLSPAAASNLSTRNRDMARSKKTWKKYARIVHKNETHGGHCIQCEVISHAAHLCGLNGANNACAKCVKSRRPCGKLIELEGEQAIGWLPLAEELREGIAWQDAATWVSPS
ncbi:hypothetical protein P280DRAFT_139570 [Massarina eburnea CBS 473.64]|uniref:Uncharacterized protein n=1 Tax=Massarina eburnea CBS 473.64 TaxID=1395130 RepID=A0A6A6RPQ3_9PLEO|nr:hypothetical protein P280DRAFT_139570 [Massarina eburnea CBS 473.64]